MRMRTITILAGLLLVGSCGPDLSLGDNPRLQVILDGENADETPASYELTPIIPGSNQSDSVDFEIKNAGDEALIVQSIELLSNNADGTVRNPWVTLEWGGLNPLSLFPHSIDGQGDILTALRLKFIYKPGNCSGDGDCMYNNAATIEIKTNDPDNPVFTIIAAPPSCQPDGKVSPPSATYFNATVSKPETKIFQVINTGTCATHVDSCEFTGGNLSKFTMTRKDNWSDGTELLPEADPGYKPLEFRVTYQPTPDSNGDKAVINCIFRDRPTSPQTIVLSTEAQEGGFKISYDGQESNGFLDFTDTDQGCKKKTVNLFNVGPASMQVTGWSIETAEPEEGTFTHYSVVASLVREPPQVIENPPAGLQAEASMDFEVEYCGSLNGMNAHLVLDFNFPESTTVRVPMFGGTKKSCFDYAPGDRKSPLTLRFIGDKDQAVDQDFVVYNCGNAPLTLTGMNVVDGFIKEDACEYWTVADAPTANVEIPVGGLKIYTATMQITDGELSPRCGLLIDYLDPNGEPATFGEVSLKGDIGPSESAPVADAGGPYAGAAGQPITLSGAASTQGSSGIVGYYWYLVEKPATSQLIINGQPDSAPVRVITPDQPGTYKVALRVQGGLEKFLESDAATATIEVTAGE